MDNVTIPFQCPYCQNFEQTDNLEADHIIPLVDGGLNRFQNIVLVCRIVIEKNQRIIFGFCHRKILILRKFADD